jgi:predicted aldo/keto reductase-like oxidoreductase
MNPIHRTAPEPDAPRVLNRREFMRTLSEAAVGGGFIAAAFAGCSLTPSQRAEAAEAVTDRLGKLPKRDLGKRLGDMKVTPIVICSDWDEDLYAPALAVGANYVHKAGYWREMPEPFKKLPRESYYTDITVDSTPNNPDDEDQAYNQVTSSLKRNGLRYYDFMRAHYGWKSVNAFKNQRGTYRAFQRLKKEGKVKYFGASQHDWVPYPEIIAAEIDDGTVDHLQFFYSYGSPKEVKEIAEKARKAGISLTAMKTFANGGDRMRNDPARQAALKAPGMVGRACLREVLSQKTSDGKPLINFCVTALRNFEQFEDNIGAASTKIAMAEGFEYAV